MEIQNDRELVVVCHSVCVAYFADCSLYWKYMFDKYSRVPNKRGGLNKQGGWKFFQNLISILDVIRGGGGKLKKNSYSKIC